MTADSAVVVAPSRASGIRRQGLKGDKFYAAAPYTFLIASLLVLIFGAGKFSLDELLAKRFQARGSQQRVSASQASHKVA